MAAGRRSARRTIMPSINGNLLLPASLRTILPADCGVSFVRHYQQYCGGVEGATWYAAALLDKSIIPVPWWYSGYGDSPVVNCR